MSNIYIQEPPTHGKVLLQTTVGDIDIELWAKETPKACRNFVQLCMEGYYDGTIFHRVVKGFIVQGGDPTGSGMGGESIYGYPFKDEFHSRLRFVRRGLVAMANAGKDDNGSQFFFTLGAAPELQNKHTIFGKVTGNTLFNMLKLEETLVDQNDRPHYPHKIISTKILFNPFPDIVPRAIVRENKESEKEDTRKNQSKATKNFSLLSFGEEAEEEEAETDAVAKEFRGKSKSSHDLANDPKLSSIPALDVPSAKDGETTVDRVRKKLKKEADDVDKERKKKEKDSDHHGHEEEHRSEKEENNKADEKSTEVDEIKKQIKKLKRELKGSSKRKPNDDTEESERKEEDKVEDDEERQNNILAEYRKETAKYKALAEKLPKKGAGREEQTMAILAKFESKLKTAKEKLSNVKASDSESDNVPSDEEVKVDDKWLVHTLHFEEKGPVLAKDVNLKLEDTFEIYDPRNPINKRRRETSKDTMMKHSRR